MKIVSGLALPQAASYQGITIYSDDTQLIYETPLPLLLDHDISKKVGKVLAFKQKEDGLYYVAELDDDTIDVDSMHVSIGARYDELTNTLFIYEVSLTPSPYFETTLELVFTKKKNTENLVKSDMTTKTEQVQAQDMATIEQILQEHEQVIAEMRATIEEMQANLASVAERIGALEAMVSQAQEELTASVQKMVSEAVNINASAIVEQLDNFLAKTLSGALSNLLKSEKV